MHESPGTLFVANLARDVTVEDLTRVFSEIGPVRRAVVVCDKKTKASKGFGFVVFTIPADADLAVSEFAKKGTLIKGRVPRLDVASKASGAARRAATLEQKVKQTADKAADVEEQDEAKEEVKEKEKQETKPEVDTCAGSRPAAMYQGLDPMDDRRVVLFNLSADFTEQQLRKRLKKHGGNVVSLVRDTPHRATLTYETSTAARAAVQEIEGRAWGESKVMARRMPQTKPRGGPRQARLIVRNLGFKVDDAALRAAFEVHGPIDECFVAKKQPEGVESRGFGFVQYVCRADAEKAIKAINGVESALGPKGKGVVAVDFTMAKDLYERNKEPRQPAESKSEANDAASAKSSSSSSSSSSSESDNSDSSSDASGSESDDDDDEKSSVASEKEAAAPAPKAAPGKPEETGDAGVSEGRTLFVNNLLFETTAEALRLRFREFGPVRGVKMVVDRVTNRPRGCGFVEFWDKESAAKALAVDGPLMLEGRPVYALLAVPKVSAQSLKGQREAEVKVKSDKRHMYLAGEGKVTSAAAGPDAPKRDREAAETKEKLKSPMFFVSPTRLSIRNLNRKPGEAIEVQQLKGLILDACRLGKSLVGKNEGDRTLFPPGGNDAAPKPRVVKCVVFREDPNDKKSRSSGFGFVELNEHVHALAALRYLNNNPKFAWAAAGGKAAQDLEKDDLKPRLMVSFAVENLKKIKLQQDREEFSKRSRANRDDAEEEAQDEREEAKPGRGKRQRLSKAQQPKDEEASEQPKQRLTKAEVHRQRMTSQRSAEDTPSERAPKPSKRGRGDEKDDSSRNSKRSKRGVDRDDLLASSGRDQDDGAGRKPRRPAAREDPDLLESLVSARRANTVSKPLGFGAAGEAAPAKKKWYDD